jgi:SAM-dependent methyltransferase
VLDVRRLDSRLDLRGRFDVVISCENIEHVLDDLKLMRDMADCLKPGGRLLLTTPFLMFRAITPAENGPFSTVEDGSHVRRGYTKAMLEELCRESGLACESVSSCSGYMSQKITWLMRMASTISPLFGWAVALPLRALPPLLDPFLRWALRWPDYSICMEAYKPRIATPLRSAPAAFNCDNG